MTIEEQKEIIEYAKMNYLQFDSNGFNKWKKSLDELDNLPQCIWEIKKRIIEKESLENAPQEPILKDQIGYMIEGGNLHLHVDKNTNGLIHTRYNVYVQIPYEGGTPIYSNHRIDVKEREYTICRSGIDFHYTEKVKGHKERIILSFGFLLPYERISNIKYKFTSIV
jgi:hypothetical protein